MIYSRAFSNNSHAKSRSAKQSKTHMSNMLGGNSRKPGAPFEMNDMPGSSVASCRDGGRS